MKNIACVCKKDPLYIKGKEAALAGSSLASDASTAERSGFREGVKAIANNNLKRSLSNEQRLNQLMLISDKLGIPQGQVNDVYSPRDWGDAIIEKTLDKAQL